MSMASNKSILAVVFSALLLVVAATPVLAEGPATLELQAPKEMSLGGEVRVAAVLRDGNGAPIPGATIILWTPADFLSVGGAIQLGKATTDAQGRVAFLYEARSEGTVTLSAYSLGDARYPSAQASVQVNTLGSEQLTRHPREGVRVPGIGVWILVAILGGVWSTYFTVMVLLTLIARAGSQAAYPYDHLGGRRG